MVGLRTINASDKMENHSLLIHGEGLDKAGAIIIADTIFDYHLAEDVGCMLILIAYGHQSKECLGVCNIVKVVDDFSSLIKTNSMGKMYEQK